MKRLTARPKASGTKRAHERRALLLPNGAYSSSMNENAHTYRFQSPSLRLIGESAKSVRTRIRKTLKTLILW